MAKVNKNLIFLLIFLIVVFFAVSKNTNAGSLSASLIEEIKYQLSLILEKINDLQLQLNELIASENSENSSLEKTVKVVSPVSKERWDAGKIYDIKWESTGYPSSAKVVIKLLDEKYNSDFGTKGITIAETANSGSYSWELPYNFNGYGLYGSLYKIVVYAEDSSAVSEGYFTINMGVPTYLNIIYPAGGEFFKIGDTYRIKWDSLLNADIYKVSITLYRNNISYMTLAEKITNNSYYDWEVPDNISGSSYKLLIKITDQSNTLITSRESNYFTIIQ